MGPFINYIMPIGADVFVIWDHKFIKQGPGRDSGNDFRFPNIAAYSGCFHFFIRNRLTSYIQETTF